MAESVDELKKLIAREDKKEEKNKEDIVAQVIDENISPLIDPSTIRTTMPNRSHICKVDDAIDEVAFDVLRRIRTGVIKTNFDIRNNATKKNKPSSPRILCMVYTHSGAHDRIQAIVNTWGSQCDGFFAASNKTDLSINTINLAHKGPEAYNNMWQKVRSMWRYVHDFFLHDYDYFHISGDDSYVVVDNMKAYFLGEQVERLLRGHVDNISRVSSNKTSRWKNLKKGESRPLLFGVPLTIRNNLFPQGGGGYTLNREALKRIGLKGGPLDTVLADNVDSREDVFIATLLAKIDTYVSDTRDDGGAFRYIPYRPKHVFQGSGKYPEKWNITTVSGMSKFSNETVALHLRDMDDNVLMDEVIYRTHDIVSGTCDFTIF